MPLRSGWIIQFSCVNCKLLAKYATRILKAPQISLLLRSWNAAEPEPSNLRLVFPLHALNN